MPMPTAWVRCWPAMAATRTKSGGGGRSRWARVTPSCSTRTGSSPRSTPATAATPWSRTCILPSVRSWNANSAIRAGRQRHCPMRCWSPMRSNIGARARSTASMAGSRSPPGTRRTSGCCSRATSSANARFIICAPRTARSPLPRCPTRCTRSASSHARRTRTNIYACSAARRFCRVAARHAPR